MAHQPNPSSKGPKVTQQTGNKGPIIGKMTSPVGSTQPWHLNKGSTNSKAIKGGNKR
jgi:hypothetical protein